MSELKKAIEQLEHISGEYDVSAAMSILDEQHAARERQEARRVANIELEREAVALIKQYGFFLPAPAKAFFRKLAIFLNWQELTKELK
jgi:hypothetical protein